MSRAQIIVEYIKEFERRFQRDLTIVETGTIRNAAPQYASGDGHSTLYVARYLKETPFAHRFYSIDLDVSVAETVLSMQNLLSQVYFLQGNSLKKLQAIREEIHVAYLDSANNAAYILEEFKLVEAGMSRGVIIIDDVNMESTELLKGHLAVPYAQSQGYVVHLLERQAVVHIKR